MPNPFTCIGHQGAVYALASRSDGERFLSAGGDGWIVEWHLSAPEKGLLLAAASVQLFSLLALPNGRDAVAGDMNGGTHWIDLSERKRIRGVQHHHRGVFDLKYREPWVLSAGGEGTLSRWDVRRQNVVESVRLSHRSLRAIALAEGRREIAVGASDTNIYLLDSETLQLRHTLCGAHTPSTFSLAYAPDERYLLSGGRDAMLRVWDLTGPVPRLVQEQPAHWFTINHIAWSPSGRYFATASRDKTVKIWDSATFRLCRVFDPVRNGGHISSVNRLLWLPEALISAGDDRTIKIWKLGPEFCQ